MSEFKKFWVSKQERDLAELTQEIDFRLGDISVEMAEAHPYGKEWLDLKAEKESLERQRQMVEEIKQ